MVGGGYFVIAGQLRLAPFLVSVPYGLGVASILVGKHIDQRPFDVGQGQRTLPVMLGERGARALNQALVALMYVVVAVLVATGTVSLLAGVVVAALPRGLQAIALMGRPSRRQATWAGRSGTTGPASPTTGSSAGSILPAWRQVLCWAYGSGPDPAPPPGAIQGL